jgi:MoxR-like ATPase
MSELRIRDVAALRGVVERARTGLTERESLVEVLVLAAIAGEHVLVVGPPGTAKSEAVRRVAAELGGRYFEYLLGRFTEPNEVFGPIDLNKLRAGPVEVQTAGMLPEAEIAFTSLMLDFTFATADAADQKIARIDIEATFHTASEELMGHTVISFVPLAGDPFARATLQDPVAYDFSGRKVDVPAD